MSIYKRFSQKQSNTQTLVTLLWLRSIHDICEADGAHQTSA